MAWMAAWADAGLSKLTKPADNETGWWDCQVGDEAAQQTINRTAEQK